MDDFHSMRKGVVYPEFSTQRRGLSDPTRKADKVMDKLDAYLAVRAGHGSRPAESKYN